MTAETPGQAACVAWNEHYAEQYSIEARNEWAASDPRGRAAWEAAAKAGHAVIAAQDARPAPELRGALDTLVANWHDYSKYQPTDTHDEITEHAAVEECAGELDAILDEHPDATAKPAPELAEPVTVEGVLCRDYPAVVAAMQAVLDRRQVVFLRVIDERDQLLSDLAAACSHRDLLAAALARIEARTNGYGSETNMSDVHRIAAKALGDPAAQ